MTYTVCEQAVMNIIGSKLYLMHYFFGNIIFYSRSHFSRTQLVRETSASCTDYNYCYICLPIKDRH